MKNKSSTLFLLYNRVNCEGANVISRENGVCGSLLLLASTGDRTIQALLENQVQIILYQPAWQSMSEIFEHNLLI